MNTPAIFTASLLCLSLAACAGKPATLQPPLKDSNEQASPPAVIVPETSTTISGGQTVITATAPAPQACDIGSAINWMAAQTIDYTSTPADEWRDCSGNFLRLSSRIATICPGVELAAPAGISKFVKNGINKRPGVAQARTTRGLAEWYDQKGLFTPIYYDNTPTQNSPPALQAVRNRIKPGSVLWFSRKKPQSEAGKAALYDEATGMINHMGTVVSVKRDEQGNVIDWTMYHGQNKHKNNGITQHWWTWPAQYTRGGTRTYPPGGYWDQRIVGFADSIIPTQALQLSDNSN